MSLTWLREGGMAGSCCLETCGALLNIRGRNEGSVSQQYFAFFVLLPITFFVFVLQVKIHFWFNRELFQKGRLSRSLSSSTQGTLHCKDPFPQLCTGASSTLRSLPCCFGKIRINEVHLPIAFQGNWKKGKRSLLV